MDSDTLTRILIEYRYWILIPLSLIEGPIVAFVAGTLSSLGYFNIFVLGVVFFVRDMAMDALYYAIGYYGGQTKFFQRMLAKAGITDTKLENVKHVWKHHAGKTMFLGKLAYGIATAFVIAAGSINLPLRTFFGWGAIVAITQFWTLLVLGYFFGNSLGTKAEHFISNVQYILLAASIVIIMYYAVALWSRKGLNKEMTEGKD